MANRNIGMGPLVIYLLLFWGGVAALLVFVTSNSAPGVPELAWADSDEGIFTTTKLKVEITADAPDADGDKIDYVYSWTHNGEPLLDSKGEPVTARSVSSKNTMSGDTLEVRVTPNDGSMDGWGCSLPWRECATLDTAGVLSVTIQNTPPRARLTFVDPSIDPENEEGIDPEIESFDKRQDVALDLACFDPDVIDLKRQEAFEAAQAAAENPEPEPEPAEGEEAEEEEEQDPCTYTVGWFPIEDEEAELPEDAEPFSTETQLSSRDLRKAGTWVVRVIANDGTEDGEMLEEKIRAAE